MFIVAIIIGVVSGFLSTHGFSLGWYNLVFWGIVGVGTGLFCPDKKTALWTGTLYGFCLSLSFLFSGFQGVSSKFLVFTVFSLGLSVVGAIGGLTASCTGYWIRKNRLKSS